MKVISIPQVTFGEHVRIQIPRDTDYDTALDRVDGFVKELTGKSGLGVFQVGKKPVFIAEADSFRSGSDPEEEMDENFVFACASARRHDRTHVAVLDVFTGPGKAPKALKTKLTKAAENNNLTVDKVHENNTQGAFNLIQPGSPIFQEPWDLVTDEERLPVDEQRCTLTGAYQVEALAENKVTRPCYKPTGEWLGNLSAHTEDIASLLEEWVRTKKPSAPEG